MEQGRETLNRFLTDLFDRFQRAEAAFFHGADLSPQEARLLETVCQAVDGGLDNRSTAIAAARRVTAGALASAAKLLGKKGYLTRPPDERDRRVVRLQPTELGRKASEGYAAFRRTLMENALSCLTEDEAAALTPAADKLAQVMGRGPVREKSQMEGYV